MATSRTITHGHVGSVTLWRSDGCFILVDATDQPDDDYDGE